MTSGNKIWREAAPASSPIGTGQSLASFISPFQKELQEQKVINEGSACPSNVQWSGAYHFFSSLKALFLHQPSYVLSSRKNLGAKF